MQNIILTGSLSFDNIFDIPDPFTKYIIPEKVHQINVSITTDKYRKTYGGTAGNQAFYLARLGMNPYVVATAGRDFTEYQRFLKKNKIRTDFIKIIKNQSTAAGFAMTDISDNQIWMFSVGAMKKAREISLLPVFKKLNNSFVMISPNDLLAMTNYINECISHKVSFGFDPAFFIPHFDSSILLRAVKSAAIIFGNDYELALIEKKIAKKVEQILSPQQILVQTLGEKGSKIFNNNRWIKIGISKTKVTDPTGAGDAYRSGFLYGYLQNLPIKTCGWMGAVTASFAVEISGTINLKFSKSSFGKRLVY